LMILNLVVQPWLFSIGTDKEFLPTWQLMKTSADHQLGFEPLNQIVQTK
jgi:hypothetical protein